MQNTEGVVVAQPQTKHKMEHKEERLGKNALQGSVSFFFFLNGLF